MEYNGVQDGIGDAKCLIFWSGRPGSNRRRPAWENASTSFIKDLPAYCVHHAQSNFPSFDDFAANGITKESRPDISSMIPSPVRLIDQVPVTSWVGCPAW